MQTIVRLRTSLLGGSALRRRIVSGGFWSLIGSVISQGAAFGASILCAHLLGKSVFGELGIVRNTISVFGIFAGLGLGVTATKHVAEFRVSDPARTARIIRLCTMTALISGIVLTGILLIGAPMIAARSLAAPHLTGPLMVGSLLLFIYAFDGAQKGVLAGFEAYKTTAYILAVGGLMTFTTVFAGVWFWGLYGALAGFVISGAAVLVLNFYAIRRLTVVNRIPAYGGPTWSERAILGAFSIPAFLGSAMVGPTMWAANALLVNQAGGYAQMGIITATSQMNLLAMFVPRSMLQILLPVLSMELNRKGQTRTNARLLIINSYMAFFLTTSMVAFLLYATPWLLRIFGKDFADGRPAMVFTLCSLPILTYKDGIARFIQAKSLLWYGFVSNLMWSVVLLIGVWQLVDYGAAGVSLAYLIAYVVNSLVFVPLYYVKLDMNRQLRRDALLGGILSAAVIPGALSNFYAISPAVLIGLVMMSAALVATATWLLWQWMTE